MDDLISRKALLEAYDLAHKGPPGNARRLIEEAPAVAPDKRLTPMKPIYKGKVSVSHVCLADGTGHMEYRPFEDYFCPNCDWIVGERYNRPHDPNWHHDQRKCNFCNACGQAIDWSDENGTA